MYSSLVPFYFWWNIVLKQAEEQRSGLRLRSKPDKTRNPVSATSERSNLRMNELFSRPERWFPHLWRNWFLIVVGGLNNGCRTGTVKYSTNLLSSSSSFHKTISPFRWFWNDLALPAKQNDSALANESELTFWMWGIWGVEESRRG